MEYALRSILKSVQNLQHCTPFTPVEPPHVLSIKVPSLNLPQPPSIYDELITIGLDSCTAHELSNRFLKKTSELRQETVLNVEKLSSRLAVQTGLDPKYIGSIVSAYEGLYTRAVKKMSQEAFKLSQERVSRSRRLEARQTKKRQFNQEYIPLLETYFSYNAYPSLPDRMVLSRKSMMTPRQIEVWFQNHRTRARKEGKVVKKLSTDVLPLQICLESLEAKMPFFTVPQPERKIQFETCPSIDEPNKMTPPPKAPSSSTIVDVLNVPAPSHAFPTIFRHSHRYDHFPNDNGISNFPPPIWFRKPVSNRPAIPSPICMDDLVAQFAMKLNLREGTSHKLSRENSNTSLSPWFAATTTVPSPAPHPALIRTPVVCSASSLTQSSEHILSTHLKRKTSFRRKARLPKRSPQDQSTDNVISVLSSHSSIPRSSSFGSNTSSRRSSSSSPPITPLTTPSSSPVLSAGVQLPSSDFSIDSLDMLSQIIGHLPNDPAAPHHGNPHPGNTFEFRKHPPTPLSFNLDACYQW